MHSVFAAKKNKNKKNIASVNSDLIGVKNKSDK
jgi:hypothetical protein